MSRKSWPASSRGDRQRHPTGSSPSVSSSDFLSMASTFPSTHGEDECPPGPRAPCAGCSPKASVSAAADRRNKSFETGATRSSSRRWPTRDPPTGASRTVLRGRSPRCGAHQGPREVHRSRAWLQDLPHDRSFGLNIGWVCSGTMRSVDRPTVAAAERCRAVKGNG